MCVLSLSSCVRVCAVGIKNSVGAVVGVIGGGMMDWIIGVIGVRYRQICTVKNCFFLWVYSTLHILLRVLIACLK